MKIHTTMKLFTPLLLLLVAFSPTGLQQDVEKQVSQFIKTNAVNAESYEPVKFGKVEKFLTHYFMTEEGRKDSELFAEYGKKAKESKNAGDIEEAQKYLDKGKELMQGLTTKFIKHKPAQYGWKVVHEYRLKNGDGQANAIKDTFYLNKQLQVIDKDTIRVN